MRIDIFTKMLVAAIAIFVAVILLTPALRDGPFVDPQEPERDPQRFRRRFMDETGVNIAPSLPPAQSMAHQESRRPLVPRTARREFCFIGAWLARDSCGL
jgi:hypothetical protein